jgi:hypothetical protein
MIRRFSANPFAAFKYYKEPRSYRLLSKMSLNPSTDRQTLFSFSSRLREGRALAEDVWSIFKFVQIA